MSAMEDLKGIVQHINDYHYTQTGCDDQDPQHQKYPNKKWHVEESDLQMNPNPKIVARNRLQEYDIRLHSI